jgi:hypothetical protein
MRVDVPFASDARPDPPDGNTLWLSSRGASRAVSATTVTANSIEALGRMGAAGVGAGVRTISLKRLGVGEPGI